MKHFDCELETAMQRMDAPEGFAERVMARAMVKAPAKVLVMPSRWTRARAWTGGAVAAVLALGVFAGGQQYQRHGRERAAEEQFEMSTRITDKALEHARSQLRAAGVNLED